MALPTPLVTVNQLYSIDQWRVRTNDTITRLNTTTTNAGDLALLGGGETNLVSAINNVRTAGITNTTNIATNTTQIGTIASLQGGETNLVSAINNTRSFALALSIALG